MKVLRLRNIRRGLATNSSSTHYVIYKKDNEVFEDMGIFDKDFYERYDPTIAASKEAKIKYIATQIYFDNFLMKLLEERYPEMKKYNGKIAKQHMSEYKDVFGGAYRDRFGADEVDNIEFQYDVICKIIDDPELVIVGGSDENNFVYDTIEGHHQMDYGFSHNKERGEQVVKNGTYWVIMSPDKGNKMRLSTSKTDALIPEQPELIDIKITDKCSHGCPFCYQGATAEGKHCNERFLYSVVRELSKKPVEFAVGGGNILEHPNIKNILYILSECGYKCKNIVNITITKPDIKDILSNQDILDAIRKYVNGIGISVSDNHDLGSIKRFMDELPDKEFVIHMIPEMLGVEKTLDLIKQIKERVSEKASMVSPTILFLGYKETGRGKDVPNVRFTEKELKRLFGLDSEKFRDYWIGIDTCFVKHYPDFCKENFSQFSYTETEGEFSMYIDAVNEVAYKSSYELENGYELKFDEKEKIYDERKYSCPSGIKQAFRKIRREQGLPIYPAKYTEYWAGSVGSKDKKKLFREDSEEIIKKAEETEKNKIKTEEEF